MLKGTPCHRLSMSSRLHAALLIIPATKLQQIQQIAMIIPLKWWKNIPALFCYHPSYFEYIIYFQYEHIVHILSLWIYFENCPRNFQHSFRLCESSFQLSGFQQNGFDLKLRVAHGHPTQNLPPEVQHVGFIYTESLRIYIYVICYMYMYVRYRIWNGDMVKFHGISWDFMGAWWDAMLHHIGFS